MHVFEQSYIQQPFVGSQMVPFDDALSETISSGSTLWKWNSFIVHLGSCFDSQVLSMSVINETETVSWYILVPALIWNFCWCQSSMRLKLGYLFWFESFVGIGHWNGCLTFDMAWRFPAVDGWPVSLVCCLSHCRRMWSWQPALWQGSSSGNRRFLDLSQALTSCVCHLVGCPASAVWPSWRGSPYPSGFVCVHSIMPFCCCFILFHCCDRKAEKTLPSPFHCSQR